MTKFALFAITVFIPLTSFGQQTLVLRDGTRYSGSLVRADENSITFRDERGQRRDFDSGQVQSIQFDGPQRDDRGRVGSDRNDSDSRSRSGNTPNSYGERGNRADFHGFDAYRPDSGMRLPSGTQISVRTNETINAQNSNDGRTYSAHLDSDVTDGSGNVLIPRGAEAQLTVRNSGNQLALDLQSVSVNGQRYNVDSEAVTQQSQSREGVGTNRRTAEYVGGGTVLGTLLGAVAGGGKGAAIGALAGAAAGAGTQVLTRGTQVRVPAETILNFRLDQPLTLNPNR